MNPGWCLSRVYEPCTCMVPFNEVLISRPLDQQVPGSAQAGLVSWALEQCNVE